MTSAAEAPAQAKHRLLAAAGDLFYAKGIHAVGVDAVVAASGVAKMTLYKHFGSKDALVAACLRKASEDWRAGFERSLARVAPAPAARLAAFFDVFAEWFADPSFRGCPLLNALCELPDAAHPARPIILEHRRLMLDLLTRLAWDAGVRDHQALAKSLSLLADGAVVAAMAEGSPEPARHAAVAARAIINAAQK
jgi:AcrR family transcriptional regulator